MSSDPSGSIAVEVQRYIFSESSFFLQCAEMLLIVFLKPMRCSRHDMFHMYSPSLYGFFHDIIYLNGQAVSYQQAVSRTISAVPPECNLDDYILVQGFAEKACVSRKVKSARITMIIFFPPLVSIYRT